MCCHNSFLRVKIKHILCDSTRRLLEACTWFPPHFAPSDFPLYWYYFVSFCYNKSYPWIQLYAESYESSWWVTEPSSGPRNPQHSRKCSRLINWIHQQINCTRKKEGKLVKKFNNECLILIFCFSFSLD